MNQEQREVNTEPILLHQNAPVLIKDDRTSATLFFHRLSDQYGPS